MAISVTGSVFLTYGAYSQDEAFTADVVGRDYTAGSGRAVVATALLGVGAVADAGEGSEGLLLITNDNTTAGDLSVSLDTSAYDIRIPPTMSNLISVGPDHAIKVGVAEATVTSQAVASVSSTTITFGGSQSIGTALMTRTSGYGTGTYMVRFTSATVAETFTEDGDTVADLSSIFNDTSVMTLAYLSDYHYVLTEA